MKSIIVLAGLIATATATLNVTFCSDNQCKETPLGTYQLNRTTGCQTDFAVQALAVKVQPSSDEDSSPNQAIRFYRSTDCFGHCGSGHLLSQTSNGFQMLSRGIESTVSPMQSWELVELDKDGHYPPHGYCGIRHGDAQYFRKRTWKWQQIGYTAFREVPVEEWDDALYPKLDGDYDMHGSVGKDGKFKWQQVAADAWSGVPLEEWDDEMNARNTEPLVYDDDELEYMDNVEVEEEVKLALEAEQGVL